MSAAPATSTLVLPDFPELVAPEQWQSIDFVSDMHLQAAEPATVQGFLQYLRETPADAVFLLGDVFEVWVGDDAINEPGSFEGICCAALHTIAQHKALYFMRGNRDFLTGSHFDAAAGTTTLEDPTLLVCGASRLLLSHGDALCLDDVDYQIFRKMVRAATWQDTFLAQSLATRRQQAQGIRNVSKSHKQSGFQHYADVDTAACRNWLTAANATTLIHGHTHRPADHSLGDQLTRRVLSDWDLAAQPPRSEVLRWERHSNALQRVPALAHLATPTSAPTTTAPGNP